MGRAKARARPRGVAGDRAAQTPILTGLCATCREHRRTPGDRRVRKPKPARFRGPAKNSLSTTGSSGFSPEESDNLHQNGRLTGDGGRPGDDRCGLSLGNGGAARNRDFKPVSGVQILRTGPEALREWFGVAPPRRVAPRSVTLARCRTSAC